MNTPRKKLYTRRRKEKLVERALQDPAESVRRFAPTKVRVTFQCYEWEASRYRHLPHASRMVPVRNAREWKRLHKAIETVLAEKKWTDEACNDVEDADATEGRLEVQVVVAPEQP